MADAPSPNLLAAAERGDAEAQNELGRFYGGLGSAAGAEMAERWFQRAAEQGLPKAMHNLGILAHRAGRDGLAEKWLGAAVERGWMNSAMALGVILDATGRTEEAMGLYETAARKGNADAQDLLGEKAFELDCEEGYARSRLWSEHAAAQGNARSEMRLATIYHEGLGVEADAKRAVSLALRAARSGHPGARLFVAVAYEVGAGIEVDRVESAFWYSLVAPGNEQARYMLERLALSPDEQASLELKLQQATGNGSSF